MELAGAADRGLVKFGAAASERPSGEAAASPGEAAAPGSFASGVRKVSRYSPMIIETA